MRVPILQIGRTLIATVQSSPTDLEFSQLRDELVRRAGEVRALGVVVDVTALDLVDSYAVRTLVALAHMVKLRGADTVIVGIQPDVAFTMVQLGLGLNGVATALDLEGGIEILNGRPAGGSSRVR